MWITSSCRTTVGSTVQNLNRWTPAFVTECFVAVAVAVALTLSEVLRAHTTFNSPSSAPALMSTVSTCPATRETP